MSIKHTVLGFTLTTLSLLSACRERSAEQPARATAGDDGFGTIVLALTTVPSDVRCVRVMVSGHQMVVRSFDVTPGTGTSLTVGGLPLGQATVYEDAFNTACSSITPNTQATWVAQAPVPVVLVPQQQTPVTIVLRRPGGLAVTGDFQEGGASLAFMPASASFGDVAISAASPIVTFIVRNVSAAPVTTSLSFGGPDAPQFTIEGGSCMGQFTLQPTQSCTVDTRFRPSSVGGKTATLTASPSLGAAVVTGNGVAMLGIRLQPGSVEFPDTVVGSSSPATEFIATNRDSFPVSVPVVLTGADAAHYQITGGTCMTMSTLPGLGSCTVLVRFSPLSTGDKSAALAVGMPADDAGMVGTGIPGSGSVVFNPPAGSFVPTAVGTSNDMMFTLTNPGSVGVPLALAVSGPDAADFTVSSGTCATMTTLPALGSCTTFVRFVPATVGPKTAALTATPSFGTAMLSGSGVTGTRAAFTPSMEYFGRLVVGARVPATRTFTVTNIATNRISPFLTITGTDASHFQVVRELGTCEIAAMRGLEPGESCTVVASFLPSSAGIKRAFLAAMPGHGSASLVGEGITGTGFEFTPSTRDYGKVVVGARTSPTVTFTVTNMAPQDRTVSLAFTGTDAAQFQVLPSNTCATALRLGPGESCEVDTRFAPTSAGVKNASLTAQPAGGSASVTGTGITGPGLVFTPSPLSFGDVFVRSVSQPTTFEVLNISTRIITVQFGLTGTDPSQFRKVEGGTCVDAFTRLGPGESCTTMAAFAPTSAGPKSANLEAVPGNGAAQIQGNGVPGMGVAFDPTAFSFGDVLLGDNSRTTTFNVTNISAGGLTPSFGFGGTNPGDFRVDGGTCDPGRSLHPGDSCSVMVRFLPGGMGARTATLIAQPSLGSATVSGNVIRTTGIFLTPSSHAYGVVGVGSSQAHTFIATNGSGSAQSLSPLFSGTDGNQFSVVPGEGTCSGFGPQLPAGSQCSLQIRFAPTTVGNKSTTVILGGLGTPSPLTGTAVISSITNLVVNDTATTNPPAGTDGIANSLQWSVQSNFRAPATAFGDRTVSITATGDTSLNGKPWIRTAADSKNYNGTAPLATFTLTGRYLYLLVDDRHNGTGTRPAWLDASYTDMGFNAAITEGATLRPYSVWRKSITSGSTVTLPKINSAIAPCYIVVIE